MLSRDIVIKSWGYPIAISLILTLLCISIAGVGLYCLTVFFGVFAIASKYFDSYIIKSKLLEIESEKLRIHRDHALNDINKVESIIQHNHSTNMMTDALKDLEGKLLKMFGCCHDTDPRKKKLRTLRGNLGNFRLQLINPNCKKVVVFQEIAEETTTLRPYLEEL